MAQGQAGASRVMAQTVGGLRLLAGLLVQSIGITLMLVSVLALIGGPAGGMIALQSVELQEVWDFLEEAGPLRVLGAVVGLVIAVALAAVVGMVGRRLFAIGARLRVRDARAVLESAGPAPILYLRAFATDSVEEAKPLEEHAESPLETIGAASKGTREQQWVRILGQIGPVIALRNTDLLLPAAGAARLRASDVSWREEVKKLMSRARLVVIRVADSSGTLWEINEALGSVPAGQLLLLLDEPGHWGWLRPRLSVEWLRAPRECPEGTIAVYVDEARRARFITAPASTPITSDLLAPFLQLNGLVITTLPKRHVLATLPLSLTGLFTGLCGVVALGDAVRDEKVAAPMVFLSAALVCGLSLALLYRRQRDRPAFWFGTVTLPAIVSLAAFAWVFRQPVMRQSVASGQSYILWYEPHPVWWALAGIGVAVGFVFGIRAGMDAFAARLRESGGRKTHPSL